MTSDELNFDAPFSITIHHNAKCHVSTKCSSPQWNVAWFDFWESKRSLEIRIPSERASQEEQNGTNFSFIAPSSEEL